MKRGTIIVRGSQVSRCLQALPAAGMLLNPCLATRNRIRRRVVSPYLGESEESSGFDDRAGQPSSQLSVARNESCTAHAWAP